MKRGTLMFVGVLLLLGVNLVSAQGFGDLKGFTENVVDGVVDFGEPIFRALFGDYGGREFLFSKVLLLFLLMAIIAFSLKRMPIFENQKGMAGIVAIIVSILAVRYISDDGLIAGVLLPYGTLGFAILSFVPFALFFFVLHWGGFKGLGRRIGWVGYAIAFVLLWFSRADKISGIAQTIHLLTLAFIVASFFFDKSIHRYFYTHEMGKFLGNARVRTIAALQSEYLNILHVDTPQADRRRRAIRAGLIRWGADVP